MSLSIFCTASKHSLFRFNFRRTCLFMILATLIYCRSSAARGWGSISATWMNPRNFLLVSHCRRLSETRISMFSSSTEESKFFGGGKESFRLWRGRAENFSSCIRFCLCGETDVAEIGFKEITRCMMPREYKKILLM